MPNFITSIQFQEENNISMLMSIVFFPAISTHAVYGIKCFLILHMVMSYVLLLVMLMLLLGVFGRPSLPIQHLFYIVAILNSTD